MDIWSIRRFGFGGFEVFSYTYDPCTSRLWLTDYSSMPWRGYSLTTTPLTSHTSSCLYVLCSLYVGRAPQQYHIVTVKYHRSPLFSLLRCGSCASMAKTSSALSSSPARTYHPTQFCRTPGEQTMKKLHTMIWSIKSARTRSGTRRSGSVQEGLL